MNRNSEITRHSVPLRPHPAELKDRGYRLFQQRKGNREIAEALGIPLNTVNRWSSKGKWKVRRQLGATKREAYIQQPATNSLGEGELESLTFAEKQSRYSTMMAESALRFAETVKALSPQGLVASADKIAKLDQVARKALKLENEKPRSAINIAFLAAGNVKLAVPMHNLPAKADSSLPGSSVRQSEEKALES